MVFKYTHSKGCPTTVRKTMKALPSLKIDSRNKILARTIRKRHMTKSDNSVTALATLEGHLASGNGRIWLQGKYCIKSVKQKLSDNYQRSFMNLNSNLCRLRAGRGTLSFER